MKIIGAISDRNAPWKNWFVGINLNAKIAIIPKKTLAMELVNAFSKLLPNLMASPTDRPTSALNAIVIQ